MSSSTVPGAWRVHIFVWDWPSRQEATTVEHGGSGTSTSTYAARSALSVVLYLAISSVAFSLDLSPR